jgi:SHS2 domain-containing protein
MKRYQLFDHTADLGVEIYGRDERELFGNAGYALFDLITDIEGVREKITFRLSVEGVDREDLMINWLRELLSLFNSEKYLFRRFIIERIGENILKAKLVGEEFCHERHLIKCEIKAVTYHQIKVTKDEAGWISRGIFDI